MVRVLTVVAVAAALAILAFGGFGEPAYAQGTGRVQMGACPPHILGLLSQVAVPSQRIECGRLTVPERHAKPDGPQITTSFYRLLSPNPRKSAEPLFMLQGGPGGSADAIVAMIFYEGTSELLADRDVIVVEQRGTPGQTPELVCPPPPSGSPNPGPAEAQALIERWITGCRDALQAQGIDLTAYNTTENAADINALRLALGYPKIHLYGVSYGTYLAQNVLRNHPEGLASVVLDGVVPVTRPFVTWGGVSFNSALNRLFADCKADAACTATYGDLERLLFSVTDAIDRDPERGPAFTNNVILGVIRSAMYSEIRAQQMPAAIAALARGDLSVLVPTPPAPAEDDQPAPPARADNAHGMYLSVMCSELPADPARFPRGDYRTRIERMAFDTVLGIAAQCAWWPRDAANARASAPVSRGSIPVLVVSGVYDPITPVAFGNEVAAYLNAPHLVVNAAAHGAVGTRCGVEALADFLESPGPLPTTPCLAQMRPVFTPVEPVNDPVPTTPAG